MPDITFEKVYNALKNKGHKIFENDSKPYNLNIIGIRNDERAPDSFDDWIVAMWKFNGKWEFHSYEATTDPGLYWLKHPMSPLGTAIVKEGQYPGSHKLGHHFDYEALQQVGNLTIIRDYNLNGIIDYSSGKEYTGNNYGINIHRARPDGKSIVVDKWSAGCQVIADSRQFDEFLQICKQAVANKWGETFTYTLINMNDL
jgi:hypothetical protein